MLKKKKTIKTWMSVLKSWAESKGLNDDTFKYEAKEIKESLSRFFAEVRKSDGSDYDLDSLRVMFAALDRHLKHNSKITLRATNNVGNNTLGRGGEERLGED